MLKFPHKLYTGKVICKISKHTANQDSTTILQMKQLTALTLSSIKTYNYTVYNLFSIYLENILISQPPICLRQFVSFANLW